MQKKILFLIGLIISVLSCNAPEKVEKDSRVNVLPYYQDATFTPVWMKKEDKKMLQNFHQIPAFRLQNQNGEWITDKKFENKIYITDFFFTSCPGICPKMTNNMLVLQEVFKEDSDVLLLSHSVTPTRDSVAVLAKYAEIKSVDASKWDLVTGNREDIYNLGRNFYFVEEDLGLEKAADDFLHTENFVLIDQNKHIRGIYNGLNATAIQQLIGDVKTLQKEVKE
jgi:protein SCO1/2